MKTKQLSRLRVQHPTVIGKVLPVRRIIGSPEEEARLSSIREQAEASGEAFRKAMESTQGEVRTYPR